MTIKMTFTAIKDQYASESPDVRLLHCVRAYHAEHPDMTLEDATMRVAQLEPELHRQYLALTPPKEVNHA